MSGTTFTTYPVQSHSAAQAAPKSGGTDATALEKSYLSATAQHSTPSPMAASPQANGAPGPGVTTLALGEEDGGAAMAAPETGAMSSPAADADYQVTTLAIGEEDGGGSQASMIPATDPHNVIGGASGMTQGYGAMQPIYSPGEAQYDAYATTSRTPDLLNFNPVSVQAGGSASYSPAAGGAMPASATGQENYGMMQPIYSPGEAEYPAFAKTSQTTDLLNFHPVARLPKTAIPQTTVAVPAPPGLSASTAAQPPVAQPVAAETRPVGALDQAVPQSGSYETVGSYESYVRSIGAAPEALEAPVAAPPAASATAPTYQAPQTTVPAAAYEPVAPAYTVQQPPASSATAPAYEAPQTTAPAAVYEPVAPDYTVQQSPAPEPVAPEPVMQEPVSASEGVQAYEPVASVSYEATAPMHSAEPQQKPALFEKDTPFDYSAGVESADPADGNPDYVAPAQETKETSAPKEAEASYVEVSIDDYLLDATPKAESGPAAKESVAATPAAPADNDAPTGHSGTPGDAQHSGPSLGGSYVVIDSPLPQSQSQSQSSPAAADGAEMSTGTSPNTPGEGLEIMTLAIGEEAGHP